MPNRRHARRTHRDAARLAAAGNHRGALAVFADAAAEYRGCLAVHPGDRAAAAEFVGLLADRAAAHAAIGELDEAYAAQRERLDLVGDDPGVRCAARLDVAEAALAAGRVITAAVEADTGLFLLEDTDPTDPGAPGFDALAAALARAARVYYRAADPDLALGAADQAARMLIAAGTDGDLLRDSLRLAMALHTAAGRAAHARGAAALLADRYPEAEPLEPSRALSLRGALQTATGMGAFADQALIDRLCPDPAGRGAPVTVSARCDLALAAVALHAAEPAVAALAPSHPGLAWRIATEVHYLLLAADRGTERNLHLNFRDHGPAWLALLMTLAGTGRQGPLAADLAAALADLRVRLHTRHAAGEHVALVHAADRYIEAHRDKLRR